MQTAAIVVDFYYDGDRHILAPRVAFSGRPFGQGSPSEATPTKTTVERFLQEVGPDASAYRAGLIDFLRTLPGRFYWGSKGFSYRILMDDKQYTILRGYPRTVWWLQGKDKGDQLQIITSPRPETPAELTRLVTKATSEVKNLEGAAATSEGAEKQVSFYVSNGLPKATDSAIRQALEAMFRGGS